MIEEKTIQNYLNNGFNVIPVHKDKTPACDWKHFQSNLMDNFKLFDTDCLAIICGKISDNLQVLDFDNHQGTARETLTKFIELTKEIYDKYNLPVIQTQSGGYHIYFRCDEINGNEKLAQIKVKGKIDTIIEVRGEGGYILAPPSSNYKLIRNKIEDLQYIEPEDRLILFEYARSFDEINNRIFKPKVETETPWNIYDLKQESVNYCKNLLQNHGWSELGFNNAWTRPGKNKGVSATFGNVAFNVFYVFTSNSEFEINRGYKPSAIRAILEFNSDFSECGKVLSKELGLNGKEEIKPKIEEKQDLRIILSKCLIDNNSEITKPPIILSIRNQYDSRLIPIFTLGNISVTKGFAKSKKTFLSSIFASCLINGYEIHYNIVPSLPNNKKNVVYIDTEQGKWDSKNLNYKILKMSNTDGKFFTLFNFRGKSSKELYDLLNFIFETLPNIGIMFIDQVADLVKSLNSEEEATNIVKFLELMTEKYNIHINTIVHINKADNYAQGWLGTQLMKKAQTIINVSKDKRAKQLGIVEPDLMRGEEFEPFVFYINQDGFPEIADRDAYKQLKDEDI